MEHEIRAAALQGFDGLVRDCGGRPDDLIRVAGLDAEMLRNPETMISLDLVAGLLELAARRLRLPTFGLRLGNRQNLDLLGMLAVVMRNSATAGDALIDVSRYLFIHSPSYDLAVEKPSRQLPDCVSLRFDVMVADSAPQRQLIDGCLSSTHRLAQLLMPIPLQLRGVSIPHTPTGSRAEYRTHFGVPVFFEQPYAALHLDAAVPDVSLAGIKPVLRDQAVAYIASRYPAADRSLSESVRSTLKSTLGAHRGTKTEIADLLDLHPRTLQRHLAIEGTNFEEIRTEVYRAAAWRLLRETGLPLSHVAAALGFSEQSVLTRSVRRWFGATPSQIRGDRVRPGSPAAVP